MADGAQPNTTTRWVYSFGGGAADGDAKMKNLLGGKGANLAEMSALGLPVPPGFTITTEACVHYYKEGQSYPVGLDAQVADGLKKVEALTGKSFGDPANPLLVSVRSGARASMPGMMDTVLNLGLNDETVAGLAKLSGDRRFAFDSYRRFIQMYSNVVLGLEHHAFEEILDDHKDRLDVTVDTDLTAENWEEVVRDYKKAVRQELGKDFPQDPKAQLWGAVGAVFASWMNDRAKFYRRMHDIPESWGTAVNVQSMVFGNMGETSATGVAFTRNPSTGDNRLYGEFLINAQGEDVVAGIRTPQNLTKVAREEMGEKAPSMEEAMPEVFAQFKSVVERLEHHYRDMQDIEFTVEQGQLYMLQTRSGKRTAKAALKVAVDQVAEGLISENEAVMRVEPSSLDQLLHPTIDPAAKRDVIAQGLPASPGAATGEIVFDADEAERLGSLGKAVILVRDETSPEDIHGMHAATGVVTARGGMTSHAAVVARGMGRPCVSGAGELHIDAKGGVLSARGSHVQGRGCDHYRRLQGRNPGRRHGDGGAGAFRRFRLADDLGGQGAPAEGAGQRRDAARRQDRAGLRRRRHRSLPHRAHVLRRDPHRRRARDDPGRRRGWASRGAGENFAVPAVGLQGAVRDHGGPARHHPPARSAVA